MITLLLTFLFFWHSNWQCTCQCKNKVICQELKKISYDMNISISIECEFESWKKFSATSKETEGYGYTNGNKLIIFGSAISDIEMDNLNIPIGVR